MLLLNTCKHFLRHHHIAPNSLNCYLFSPQLIKMKQNYIYLPPRAFCISAKFCCCAICASFAFCNTTPTFSCASKYFDTHRSVQDISPSAKSFSLCLREAHFSKHVEAILLKRWVYISISVVAANSGSGPAGLGSSLPKKFILLCDGVVVVR